MVGFGKVFMVLGALIFVGSVAWWYLYYEQFHGEEVKQASDCFYYFAESCTPSALETLIDASGVPAYSPVALWTSIGLIGLGVLLLAVSPMRR